MIYARRLSCVVKPEIPDLLISVKKCFFICRADLPVACFGSMHQFSLFTYGFRRMFIYWFFHNCSFSVRCMISKRGSRFHAIISNAAPYANAEITFVILCPRKLFIC